MIGLLLLLGSAGAATAVWVAQDEDMQVTGTSLDSEETAPPEEEPPPTSSPDEDDDPFLDFEEAPPAPSEEEEDEETTTTTESSEPEDAPETTDPADEPDGDTGGDAADDEASAGSPTDAVEAMFAATNSADCTALLESVTETSRVMFGEDPESQLAECEETMAVTPPTEMTVQDMSVTVELGDEAIVETTYIDGGGTQTEEFYVLREDSDWKVNLVSA